MQPASWANIGGSNFYYRFGDESVAFTARSCKKACAITIEWIAQFRIDIMTLFWQPVETQHFATACCTRAKRLGFAHILPKAQVLLLRSFCRETRLLFLYPPRAPQWIYARCGILKPPRRIAQAPHRVRGISDGSQSNEPKLNKLRLVSSTNMHLLWGGWGKGFFKFCGHIIAQAFCASGAAQ